MVHFFINHALNAPIATGEFHTIVSLILFVPTSYTDFYLYLSSQITLSNFVKSESLLLCKTHYIKRFKEEGHYSGEDKYTTKSNRGCAVGSFEAFNLTRTASSAEMKITSTETNKSHTSGTGMPTSKPDHLDCTAPLSPSSSPARSFAKIPFLGTEEDAPKLSVRDLIAARQAKVSATSAPHKIGIKTPAPVGGLRDSFITHAV
jgi:hypothetical protein